MALLMLIVYARISAGTAPPPKVRDIFTRDPLYPVELNLILTSDNIIQFKEEKRKLILLWSPDAHLISHQQDFFFCCADWIMSKPVIFFVRGFHKSYLRLRRLRI